ncbi:MAG: tRNA lysidine(34) synthetase TilS [Salibacteraceae bacterium]
MKDIVEAFFKAHRIDGENIKLLVATSGGIDSMCLLHVIHSMGIHTAAAHVNYGLRGDESDLDEAFVREQCQKLNISLHTTKPPKNFFEGKNIQEAARQFRYGWFDELISQFGYDFVATAHHRLDRVETTLINLMRGTGVIGLRGLPGTRGKFIRPFLLADRTAIEAYAAENGIPYREDSSNKSGKYVRNRVRNDLIPLMEKIDAGGLNRMYHSIDLIAEDCTAIEAMAAHLRTERENEAVIRWSDLPATKPDVWLYWCIRGFGFTRQHCYDLCIKGSRGAVVESKEYVAIHKGDIIVIKPRFAGADPVKIDGPGHTVWQGCELRVQAAQSADLAHTHDTKAIVANAERVLFPLELRYAHPDDRFMPKGSKKYYKLSKYLRDAGKSKMERPHVKVLTDRDGEIIWVPALSMSEKIATTDTGKNLISLQVKGVID